jgi:hypothetical protein
LKPDLPAASIRLAASGPRGSLNDDWFGVMRFFLRQKRRARAVNRAIGALLSAAAWSEPAVVAITTDRHEPGSAARNNWGARGGARPGRF